MAPKVRMITEPCIGKNLEGSLMEVTNKKFYCYTDLLGFKPTKAGI
jgi:hypothetical protein